MTSSSDSYCISAARIVLPDRVQEDGKIIVSYGRIEAVLSQQEDVPHGMRHLPLGRVTLFPGFIDVHIHGAVGFDTNSASPDGLQSISEFLLAHGVTSWLPTLVPGPDSEYQAAADAITNLIIRRGEFKPGARPLGLHYEGPFVSSSRCGALRREYFQIFDRAGQLDRLAKVDAPGAVHMTTVAPEIEGGIDLIRELVQEGWVVSIGHTEATVNILDQAATEGARHMTHFMNAMAPMNHRNPGPIGWGLLRDDVTCDLIADGVHSDRMMLQLVTKCKTESRLALISDSVAPTGMGNGEFEVWGERITVMNGRTQNERGSIAGSVITMLDAAKMMKQLGAGDQDVSMMASTNPARLLGLSGETGALEAGRRADIIALDDQMNVVTAFVEGRRGL